MTGIRVLLLVVVALTVMRPLGAQDQPAGPQPPPLPAAVQEAWEKLVYLPYRNLKSVYDREGASVVLPYLEYIKLWRQTQQNLQAPRPVDAVITEANYVATVAKDLVRIKADYKIQALKAGWSQIPLNFGDAAVGKLTSSNPQILLEGTGDGQYRLLIPSNGTHTIQLDLASRIRSSPDGRRFEFRCPTVGITTFDLSIPEADQSVAIEPRLVALPVEGAESGTRVKASLGATGRIAARWSPQSSERPEMELLASVKNLLQVHLSEGLIHRDARLTYSILRGETEQVRFVAPADDRVLDVSAVGSRIKGWRTTKEEGRQIITVELLSAVKDQFVLEVHTEKTLGMEEALPTAGLAANDACFGIHALDVVRESGELVVSHSNELAVTYDPPVGLSRINADQVPQPARRANAVFYRFYSSAFELLVTARPVEARLTANQNVVFTIQDDRLDVTSQWQVTIERAGVFGFEWTIPEGLTIRSVSTPGLSSYRVDEEENRLVVTLNEKVQGTRQVAIRGVIETESGDADNVSLPLLELTAAEREEGNVSLFAPASIEVNTLPDQLIGVQPVPPSGQAVQNSMRLVAAWTYSKRPAAIAIQVKRKATRLTARVGTRVEVVEELASVRTRVQYLIEHAGVSRLQLAIPEAVSDRVSIELHQGVAIKEKVAAEAAVDGWITWTIELQDDALGTQAIDVTYDLPESADAGEPRTLNIQAIQPLPVEPESGDTIPLSQLEGELEVARDRALSLKVAASGGDIEPIDIRERQIAVPALASSNGLIVTSAYRYHDQPVTLELQTEKHEIQEVVETVIPRALVEIVIGKDPLANYRCRYQIISSERQRLRVDLPVGIELIEPRLDEAKVALERADESVETADGWESYFVNVSRTKQSDEPFYLTLQFRARISSADQPPFSEHWGAIQLIRLPRIGSAEGDDVALQQLRVAAWVPDGFSLVGQPERFVLQNDSAWQDRVLANGDRSVDASDLQNWIGYSAAGLIDFPTEGHGYVYDNLGGAEQIEILWWQDIYLVWVLSGTLLVVAWVTRRTTWENKLGLLLFLGFLAAMYSFRDADIVIQGLRAARLGIAAMLVCWIVHGLLAPGHRPRRPSFRQRSSATVSATAAAVIPPPGVFPLQAQSVKKDVSDSQ